MSYQASGNKISDHDYQALIVDFNAKEDKSLLNNRLDRLFEKVVEAYPHKVALIHRDTEITFKELNASANILARGLRKRGLTHGDVIGLAVSRSINLIVAILAVVKLGAAYVPIDPSFPAKRIGQMVEDADCKLILVDKIPTEGSLACWKDLCLAVGMGRDGSNADMTNLGTTIDPHDLAFVIYTSGSTGRPKGVEISHGAAANFLGSLRTHEPGCDEHDRLLAITTISFDMSSLEIWLPLLSGSTMVIADAITVRNPRELLGLMETHQITILQATPATWMMLLESGWQGTPRLSKIICGGEPLSRHLADRLMACADSVWNVYGPSETTYGSVGKIGDGDIVVGHPVVNGRIYVLDEQMSPVPIGHEGEVYIGGGSVSNGYRKKPELTASRFLSNPFHGGTFFRTGDLAKFLGPGKLQVIGRADGVVKIHGNRIDVGDIEAIILEHTSVSQAVVVDRDERLVAYCVLHTHSPDIDSLDSTLRPWVTERLPAYMLPAFFIPMHELPLSPNQKVSRKDLPNPMALFRSQISIDPTSEPERQIKSIWAEVLGHDRIGVDDNFFKIGGDSVRIIRVQAALEKHLGRSVPTPKLFEHYTIKTLAAYLAGNDTEMRDQGHNVAKPHEDIAIISMACRLPGGVTTPEEMWELLQTGEDVLIDVPEDRWDANKLYHAEPGVDGTSYCRKGGFLDDIYSHDASFFGISPREAQAMDPTQHLMLELGWEGFERAGYTKSQLSGSATGIFLGVSNNAVTNEMPTDFQGYSITGSAGATMSGRLSYTLDLQGPSLTVDTACSSSLVATHLACNALRQGECDMALAGGVSLLLTPGIHIEFSKLGGISADGRCRAFSDDTGGTGFSEGAAVVLLKRLTDAQRDGDNIQAVLRSSAVMHGGYSAGLTVPNSRGQESLIRTALTQAALGPRDIDYIEAHGTATKLGDPIEATALAKVFGTGRLSSDPLRLGSIKSNVGHTQAAAGLVGLQKVVMSLQHDTLPRTLHVSEPTRAVDWKDSNMRLVLADEPWLPHDSRVRRAGISAFGIGGTNAHVIVEESPGPTTSETDQRARPNPPAEILFVLSSRTDSGLRAQAGKLWSYIRSGIGKDYDLTDVAYSLATSRTHFQHRIVVSARDKSQMIEKLGLVSSGSGRLVSANEGIDACISMLFTGQGSQQLGMGQDLYAIYPVFRDALNAIAAVFTELGVPLLDIMWGKLGSASEWSLNRTEFAQPALFALQVSLWKLWQSLGVKAAFLLGHSVGELAVAHVSGILELHDACRLIMMRGRLMQAVTRSGKMASIEGNSIDIAAAIKEAGASDGVEIAGYNTPCQTVISGDARGVEAVMAHVARSGRKTKQLDASHAFHSSHMEEMLDKFRAVAQTVRFSPPDTPIISSMTGRLAVAGELEKAEYWVQQARHAVRFSDAFETLVKAGGNVFLELGPGTTLCGLGAACLADSPDASNALWLPSLMRGVGGGASVGKNLGAMHVRGVPIDWSAHFRPFGCQRVSLPTYAFQREIGKRPKQGGYVYDTTRGSSNDKGGGHGPEKMMLEMNWRRLDKQSVVRPPRGSWGVLCPAGETAWTKKAQKALSHAGIYVVPATRLAHAEHLDGLLSLWDSDEADDDDDDDVIRTAHAFTAKALSQLQGVVRTPPAMPVVWLTRRAVGAGEGDAPEGLGAGPLWGLMRAARSEQPSLSLRLIDVDDALDDDDDNDDDSESDRELFGRCLATALMLDAGQAEVAIRKGELLVPHLERVLQQSPPSKPLLRADGAVLVTGGLGDLGGRIARRLVVQHGVRDVVLLSRRGMDSPGAAALVSQLASLGAAATVVAGDVADLDSLRPIMSTFTARRPLRGVVHAAGVTDPGILSSLTPRKCATTFAPKVDGLWNLHQLTKGNPQLDLFAIFSSISGVVGLPGLANYAAANSFADVLAHLRRAQGLPATSVAYGTWGGDGMAATLAPATRAHLLQLGLGFLTAQVGLDLFEESVRRDCALTVAAELDLGQLKAHYTAQGGVPCFLKSLLAEKDATQPVNRHADLRGMLAEADVQDHAKIVLRVVQETIARALDYTSIDDLDPIRPLREFGIDSLSAVLIRNHLTTMTGLVLPPNIALLHPNLKRLSDYLLSQLPPAASSDLSGAPEGDVKTPVGASSAASLIDKSLIQRGVLDPSIQFANVDKLANPAARCVEAVLVTGPTGFVGAFMAHEFLRRGVRVYCLVRANSVNKAQERMIATLRSYNLWKSDYENLLESVVGDLSQPLLGLCEDDFHSLSCQVDTIIHSGALVDWMRPLEDYVDPNILGTHEVLRLASYGCAKAVHFISTISTLPIHLGYGLTERDGEYGYGTSKYLAERLVSAARFRGAMTSSYRLPFVAPSSTNGHFRTDRGDFLNNLIAGSLDLGAFPSLNTDLSAVLPVDYLCNTIATIAIDDQERLGEDYDFVNPQAPTFDHFFNLMGTAGSRNTIIPFSEWHSRALQYAATHPKSSLARITTVIDGYTDETAGNMMKGLPVGKHVIGLDCYPPPLLNREYVRRYLDCILADEGKKST